MPVLPDEMKTIGSERVGQLPPAQIRAFDDEISSIPGLVKLTLGEPDFAVPAHVKQAAIASIQHDESHYSASRGTKALRQAISGYLDRTRGIRYDPDSEIIVTVGATEAITATMMGLLNPGDKVIVPSPIFSLYFPSVALSGAEPVAVDTRDDDFLLTADRLEQELATIDGQVKALVLNYPNNPTGRSYSKEQLVALAKVIKKHHLLAVVDEIYSELTYDGPFVSLASLLPGQTVLINGFSKSHAMTGYRLGYLAAPAELTSQISKVHSFMVTAPNDTAQAAGLEALTHGQADPAYFRKRYRQRRDYLVNALEGLGLDLIKPEGAFYVFVKIPKDYGTDDFRFARDLAHQAKVGVIPGSAFGPGGEGFVRLSYAAADDQLKAAVDHLTAFLNS